MVKNKNFWKSSARLSRWLMVLVALALLFPGCDDKLGKLKGKAEEAEREMNAIEKESKTLQGKIDKIRNWEKETPPPAGAIALLTAEIKSEQALLIKKREEFGKKLEAIRKEVEELDRVELSEVIDYATKTFPWLIDLIKDKVQKQVSLQQQVEQGTNTKLDALSGILDQQVALIDWWQENPPLPHELEWMAYWIAEASAISLDPELKLIGKMAEQLKHIGPLPVVAGTVVDRCSFIIEEGLPPGLEHLDNGVLAPGSEIILQLPPTWLLTAPATIESDNNNLTLDICGNEPGSSLIKMRVIDELEPNRPDDNILIRFNGIQIGNMTGIVSGTLTVLPGRSSKQDFVVLPQQCELPPLADLNFDGKVNFRDLAVLADEWLLGSDT